MTCIGNHWFTQENAKRLIELNTRTLSLSLMVERDREDQDEISHEI